MKKKRNNTLIVITLAFDNEICLWDIRVHRAGMRSKRRMRRSEPNPTVSPQVARSQLTTGWFISPRRVIAVFNHFLSLHGFFQSISSSHPYHLTPPRARLASHPFAAPRCLRFIGFPMELRSHAVSGVRSLSKNIDVEVWNQPMIVLWPPSAAHHPALRTKRSEDSNPILWSSLNNGDKGQTNDWDRNQCGIGSWTNRGFVFGPFLLTHPDA